MNNYLFKVGLTFLLLFLPAYMVGSQQQSLEAPQIIAEAPPNGSTNSSVILSYHFQIASDSAFTEIIRDFPDINIVNYPKHFVEMGTYVSFELPEEYELSEFDQYYTRVRAHKKSETELVGVLVEEPQNQNISIFYRTNASGVWETFFNTSAKSGDLCLTPTLFASRANTTYWWQACIVDIDGHWTNKTYHFTTGDPEWGNWSDWWAFTLVNRIDKIRNFSISEIQGKECISLGFDIRFENCSVKIYTKVKHREGVKIPQKPDEEGWYLVHHSNLPQINCLTYPFSGQTYTITFGAEKYYHIFNFSNYSETPYYPGWNVKIDGHDNHLNFTIIRQVDQLTFGVVFSILIASFIIIRFLMWKKFYGLKETLIIALIAIFPTVAVPSVFWYVTVSYTPMISLANVIIGIFTGLVILSCINIIVSLHRKGKLETLKKEDVIKQFTSLRGVGEVKAELIYKSGLDSLEKLKKTSVEDLTKVKGINEKLAKDIKRQLNE